MYCLQLSCIRSASGLTPLPPFPFAPKAGSFLTESTDKQNQDQYPSNSEEPGCGHDKMGDSIANRKGRWYSTRYFIIKSLNHHNLRLSIEKGIWATQVMNEPILEEAFHVRMPIFCMFI